MAEKMELPPLPAPVSDFISYLAKNKDKDMQELVQPYREFESKLREIYAQQPEHEASKTEFFNILPIFSGNEADLTIRARDVASETDEQKAKYLLPLKTLDRREHGSMAVSHSLKDFQTNFNLFSESSLSGLDWSNIVAAGSSVTTSLMPIPEEYADSKRSMRTWYHQKVAPASDVDLFVYGLTEEQAVEKMKNVERAIRDSILSETTTVRTKNAITIASEYPTRHVQIVLRTYKNISEILTGFDVDCACAAYDGKQVYATPRAIASFVSQINTVDLTRRSPSYENRLSKYARRGFEVYWPELERHRIDPTIFERSFPRTQGLARLLVLEKLPTTSERDAYIDQRRQERGRPPINRNYRFRTKLHGNLKNDAEDEVAEWVTGDEVSSYHTFTVPYGPKFNAKKIEKLLYTKDLLLNAEWNQPKEREVYLHRHPAFFGRVKHVIGDCCGYCPVPATDQEKEVSHEEQKIFISGNVEFLHDDPGRQRIGSFNPLTADDWTEMAYVSRTGQLCQAIVDCDLAAVQKWLQEERVEPYMRDFTGRTPLHLATMCSTPEIVQCLIDHGIRLVARLADGRTALHLAAIRGNVDILKAILHKSEENEEAEMEKEDAKRASAQADKKDAQDSQMTDDDNKDDSDVDMVDDAEEDDEDDDDIEMETQSRGSMVQVNKVNKEENKDDNVPDDEKAEGPDVYDVNVLAWDIPSSPLHLAIAHGHVAIVETLVQTFGADVLLPVKLVNDYDRSPRAAILTLVLATVLEDFEEAKQMTEKLLALGASSAQADLNLVTAFHYVIKAKPELVASMIEHDQPAVLRAINHVSNPGLQQSHWSRNACTPLMTAVDMKDRELIDKMLELGARGEVSFEDYMKVRKASENEHNKYMYENTEYNQSQYEQHVKQPVIQAAMDGEPEIIKMLIERGQADVNTLEPNSYQVIRNEYNRAHTKGGSLLDIVRTQIEGLSKYEGESSSNTKPRKMESDEHYLAGVPDGSSYRRWISATRLKIEKDNYKGQVKNWEKTQKEFAKNKEAHDLKREAVKELCSRFKELESFLVKRGAKGFYQLHPDISKPNQGGVISVNRRNNYGYNQQEPADFKIAYGFSLGDLTDERRQAYIDIFEAAWNGEIEPIKRYTLQRWGEGDSQSPIEIAKTDNASKTNVFLIALLRGHLDVARQILEICHAQHQPAEEAVKRYRIADEDSEDERDSEAEADDYPIYGEIVSDHFTVETIGEVSAQVKSRTTPHNMLSTMINMTFFCWSINDKASPPYAPETYSLDKAQAELVAKTYGPSAQSSQASALEFAILVDDISLVEFLLECDLKYKTSSEQSSSFPVIPAAALELAIAHGRTDILELLIRKTGAGIPLDDMVKQSGIEVKEKPQFYPGLSVYGKKRKDWAEAGRAVSNSGIAMKAHPPIMEAARLGSLKSLEWFLSDAPLRLYKDFARKHQDDKRLKLLAGSKGGVEKAISDWYTKSAELIVHCAVLSPPLPTKSALIDCALAANADSLHTASPSDGYTPLVLAFTLGDVESAKQLIAAGADQTARAKNGNNLLHTILAAQNGSQDKQTSFERFHQLIELIDGRVLPSMFCERNRNDTPSTPLGLWLGYKNRSDRTFEDAPKILKFLLEKSKGIDLTVMDGAGQLPMHQCVRDKFEFLLAPIHECDPTMLFRENATGITPFEMAQSSALSDRFRDPPSVQPMTRYYGGFDNQIDSNSLTRRSPQDFLKKDNNDTSKYHYGASAENVWRVVCTLNKQNTAAAKTRKLVTLTEANEVAKRLAEQKRRKERGNAGYIHGRTRFSRRGNLHLADVDEDEEAAAEVEQNKPIDFASMWLGSAVSRW